MSALYFNTPCFHSLPLSRHLGSEVYLKMETMQPSGSFKNRGIGTLCRRLAADGAERFISSSGGNAGLAVAYSGRMLHIPVTVVVPETTSAFMRQKIALEGAEVLVAGKNWNESDPVARQLSEPKGVCYVPPFDHPLIWEGNATLILEAARQMERPDAVICSVGGGGLFCGIVQGLQAVGWTDVPVIAVETEGAASFAKACQAGKVVTLDAIDTVAVSLGATRVAEQALDWTRHHPVRNVVVTDRQAVSACVSFANDHRSLVEPACGATLSVLYERMAAVEGLRSVLAIVCGGCGVNLEMLNRWQHAY